ncbi:uncharacterized protein LOC135709552 [Ochlerotatus camptorhynchus]|uniref:uncharacterized protein LOC135709552 n=1 Tax=Ochlerotatus camptorhynchus TaxID=644619 RepID=UPI0031D70B8D
MDGPQKWKKTLKSGHFRRKVHVYRNINVSDVPNATEIEQPNELGSESALFVCAVPERPTNSADEETDEGNSQTASLDNSLTDYSPDEDSEEEWNHLSDASYVEASQEEQAEHSSQAENLTSFLRNWSTQFNISQQALKPLLQKLNNYDRTLPESPRRLLRTPRINPTIIDIEGGQYWHQGLEHCLRMCFPELKEPLKVNININIDGLPLFKNGTNQVWPILFNLHEFASLKPMIVGIFYGKSKPKKVEVFLAPFVNELKPLITSGIDVNGVKLAVKLRAIICDSPARAFVKGVVNFNSHHGCMKCCTIGQHSTLLRTNIFPRTFAPKRTDAAFRSGMYDEHYQIYKTRENGKLKRTPVVSPLLQLPIDIVEDVIVADSLHLLHLGITKRLILAYKDGHNGSDENQEITKIRKTPIASNYKPCY